MATPEEIEGRVQKADAARSARRYAAAKRVGELAQRRTAIAEQLTDIERELADVLAESSDVISIDELAKFTDLPIGDLNQWLGARKTTHAKRAKAPAGPSSARSHMNAVSPKTPLANQPSRPLKLATGRTDTADASVRVHADVT